MITLRPLERTDLGILALWRNDPRIASQIFSAWPVADSEQESWYQRYLGDPTQRQWMIVRYYESVGTLALVNIDHRNQSAELSRVILGDNRYLQQGIMAEALGTLIPMAFGSANLQRLEVRVFADNLPAINLYRRCGFETEGVLRRVIWKDGWKDVMIMSLLRPE